MIWYLLYPLRGTTEAPVLAASHPLRDGFGRYGRYAGRHVVTTLLISVAVATTLIYPSPFLFTTDFINGASNLPYHVWTVAQPLPYKTDVEPDVIMRSVWVHASYMQALDSHLLASALELQDDLLGSTKDFSPRQSRKVALPRSNGTDLSPVQRDSVHAVNGLTNQSWFFHSPLQYWGCSKERILADANILSTVNDNRAMSTPANITLRHSMVFSGMRFEDRRLLAADALVVTLLHLRDSPVGHQWERKAACLPDKVGNSWDIYPPDGSVSASRLYEFQFRPISVQDTISLALAYGLALIYFLASLSKLRAMKSKIGLIVTAVTQVFFSIMSSFTICAIFNVNLSRIPRAAYPLVVLTMSMENIFRLINAVLMTPSEDSTSSRIGQALAKTAPVAMASFTQNVLILLALSFLVSPGVSAFCIFAALAIMFDFFYLLTFFLSVLSVDVRRMELSEALAKASMRHNRNSPETRSRPSWLEQVVQGKTALSTRIAGTVVMVGFVLIAQWHFFADDTVFKSLVRLWRERETFPFQSSSLSQTSTLKDINQARSPTSWLRLQDHTTAQEVINIIKPSSHSYIARVYEPLVFVMKNSDRTPDSKEPTLLPAAYDFVNHQLTRFIVIVVVVVAAIRLLTSYLLWEEEAAMDDQHGINKSPLMTVKTLAGGHSLDIAMLASSPDGYVISVSLDRLIRVWDVRPGGFSYGIPDDDERNKSLFPVVAMAVDSESTWLALSSSTCVSFWNLADRCWGPSVPVALNGQKPEAFFFDNDPSQGLPRLLIVRRDGSFMEVAAGLRDDIKTFSVCSGTLVCAAALTSKGVEKSSPQLAIVAASKKGHVHIATRKDSTWDTKQLSAEGIETSDIHQIVALSPLGLFLAAATNRVYLISIENLGIVHLFPTETMDPRSLQCSYLSQRIPNAESIGLSLFTLSYAIAGSATSVLQSYVPPEHEEVIRAYPRLASQHSGGCAWQDAQQIKRQVENPGLWEVLSDGSSVGIRRLASADRDAKTGRGGQIEGLRRRVLQGDSEQDPFACWQVWTASPGGRAEADEARALLKDDEKAGHLLISELGPKVKVGQSSAVFGFGNVMKLVTVGGHERFEESADDLYRKPPINVSSRRRKAGGPPRSRAWS